MLGIDGTVGVSSKFYRHNAIWCALVHLVIELAQQLSKLPLYWLAFAIVALAASVCSKGRLCV